MLAGGRDVSTLTIARIIESRLRASQAASAGPTSAWGFGLDAVAMDGVPYFRVTTHRGERLVLRTELLRTLQTCHLYETTATGSPRPVRWAHPCETGWRCPTTPLRVLQQMAVGGPHLEAADPMHACLRADRLHGITLIYLADRMPPGWPP